MKMTVRARLVLFFLFLCLASVPSAAAQPADLVFRNGAVYTLDASRSWAEAVAVSRGRIVYVGPENGIGPWIGSGTNVVDLQGKMLLPGFHDSHLHLIAGGLQTSECRLETLNTPEQIVGAVRRCAQENPQKPWIRGQGWQLPLFPPTGPHKNLLDQAVPDRPVLLLGGDGHSVWVNSRALEIAGVTRETPDPSNGRIERDPATGEPTGTLREQAITLVSKHIPPLSEAEVLDGLRQGLKAAASAGITSLHDAAASPKMLDAFAELDRKGELTARTTAAIRIEPGETPPDFAGLAEMRKKYQGKRLRVPAVKLFADGVLESQTAAVLEPYVGRNGDRGTLIWEPDVFERLIAAADREGFQIHVHAIGDRAIRLTLDAFEKARAANGRRDARHMMAHIQLIDPQDLPRFRKLGVIADFQPLWAQEDPYMTQLTIPFLGPERARWIYPIHSVAKTGAVLASGSDWPVSTINPLAAIQVAMTRRALTAAPGPAWIPEEVIDLPTALASYTIQGAYANFQEAETGSIEVGKAADLVVLERDLFAIPPSEIYRVKVLLTLLEGKEIYRDPGFRISPGR
jgi:predicted amidohydrolase YtcJ